MGSVFNDFPNVLLAQVAVVEPAGRRTMDAFTRSDEPGENSEMALWNHKTTVMQSMAAKPDTGITGVVAKAKMAAKYWRQRGTFLLPQRLYLPATRTQWGGACQPRRWSNKESLKKALCAYVNSSVGIGAMLSIRSNKAPTDPRFALNDLRGLRVPNFDVLDKSAEESLAGGIRRVGGDCAIAIAGNGEMSCAAGSGYGGMRCTGVGNRAWG